MKRPTKVLIIEDESGIALALYRALTHAYKVDTAKTGASGLRKAESQRFDVIILDLGLPDMSGLTICKRLRENGVQIPIIVLTGESSIKSKVTLLDAGATDYLTKPFSLEELQARLRASLRSDTKLIGEQRLVVGELTLDMQQHSVKRGDRIIPLRRKEFAILECLMQHAGTVVSRASLMNYAWDGNDETWTNTIDVHIKHLRDKIDRPFSNMLIKTVHGLGYKLETSSTVAKIL